ncbi:MAG: aminotransferase [Bacillota bacterium]|nr:MAG: aminotransferase [Bacillota bacterium]
MQALMLAAGMGKRLGKYTGDNTKCMVEVAGKKLIDRAVDAVIEAGIRKFVLVVGYKAEHLTRYIEEKYAAAPVDFVFIYNREYAATNNIYSFYLAREELIKDDTVLLESDLIFDCSLIRRVCECEDENLAVVAKYESWMDGTVVTCDESGKITQFIEKADMNYALLSQYYKTVNVYKLSKKFSQNVYLPFLKAYMQAYGKNCYYEAVLKVVAHLSLSELKAFFMDDLPWYEIDSAADLDIANVLFADGGGYDLLISKFGGYWRYPKLLDFCYLVNPYFPPKKFTEKLSSEFSSLLTAYPSGLNIQNMNAESVFGVSHNRILVGNGAAELINALGAVCRGRFAVSLPTFNEYVRCFRNAEVVPIDNSVRDYRLDFAALCKAAETSEWLCVVSPDNPSGCLLSKQEVLALAEHCEKFGTQLVVDESFIDFADAEKRYTLLDDAILDGHSNLTVIKSISKSYGVPGLRLGVLASGNADLIASVRREMQVWNINSFAEYFLQIFNLYAKYYVRACDKIAKERRRFTAELSKLNVYVYPSQANFIMVDLKQVNSYEFCVRMMEKHNILIKDLSSKNYFEGKNFIRVAIRDEKDNDIFLAAIKDSLTNGREMR